MSQCATLLHKFCQLKQGLDWHMVLLVVVLCTTCIPTALCPWLLYLSFGCSTYSCYVYTKEIPGLIFTGLILPVSIILSILHWGRIKTWYMRLENIMELIFSNYLKNCKFNNREEKLFTTQGYEANVKEMYWLTIIMVQATFLAGGQFLNDFLVEVSNSYSADPNLCCYYTTLLVPNPQINCLNASQVEEATPVICYKYELNIGQAAASAIGIISATGLIIYIIGYVSLKLIDKARLVILIVKTVAIAEITGLGVVIALVQVLHTSRAATVLGFMNLISKTLGMGVMIATSVLYFPVNKFRRSENRDGYEPINNDDPA